jgi:hypothetical protein
MEENIMRDAYERFFEYFGIDFEEVIKFGVEKDTIYPDSKKIQQRWEKLKKNVLCNKEVYIRGYGANQAHTDLYKRLYEILLGNKNVQGDPRTNTMPTRLLEEITGYLRNGNNPNIRNYQVSHIFGKTKNPFLFTAPWNIVWKPKIFDPFTGHEAQGDLTQRYRESFLKKVKDLYKDYIKDYNELASKYFSDEELNKALAEIKKSEKIEERVFNRFRRSVRQELETIE